MKLMFEIYTFSLRFRGRGKGRVILVGCVINVRLGSAGFG